MSLQDSVYCTFFFAWYNRISGLFSAGSRVASATVAQRRCADNGGDHQRPVPPKKGAFEVYVLRKYISVAGKDVNQFFNLALENVTWNGGGVYSQYTSAVCQHGTHLGARTVISTGWQENPKPQ